MINPNTGVRELAYLVTVGEIDDIPGYDRIALAHVNGWTCVVGKADFKQGDLAVYFEVDSKVDENNPAFAFLAAKHFNIKVQRYCKGKCISFGLLMPVDVFGWKLVKSDDKVYARLPDDTALSEGDFVTERLKVTYAEPADNTRKANINQYTSMAARHHKLFKNPIIKKIYSTAIGRKLLFVFFGRKKDKATAFPTHLAYVKKSDEEKVENMPFVLKDKRPFAKTTKIDGTSCTFILERKSFGRYEYYVCSRNVRQLDPHQKNWHSDDENLYWEISDKYNIKEFLMDFLKKNPDMKYCAIQGEGAGLTLQGAAIQGNPHKFDTLRFFGFNFIDSNIGRWDSLSAAALAKEFGIEWVPIVDSDYHLPDTMEEMKATADGPCEAPGAHGLREGYVYRCVADPNLSFKNVSTQYLLNKK